jgi:photosystem II stability/assembly factor-like uncharacterized protein
MKRIPSRLALSALVIALAPQPAIAQGPSLAGGRVRGGSDPALPPDSVLVRSLVFRSIGPALMGGRIADIAVAENPKGVRGRGVGTVIYIAVATGGVYRSTNAGVSWTPVFDSVRTGSVGAVAVAPTNSDIVWIGTGEANNMRSSSWGTGVYKSTDAGRTWSSAMLPKSQHIGRIVIDPRDPNVVYVAALGPLWAPGGERGLYKTTDGGRTWVNTKSISPFTGFVDLQMDPSNPDVLYAAAQQRERREYSFLPGGPESGIFKTIDGGRTWTQLAQGLPSGEIGRIGLSVCRSKPATVYATVHARGTANGIYRSDDAGASWRQVNNSNGTAWYYSQIRCDPADPEHVITLNAQSRESWDGGKTWQTFAQGQGVHSDHHALWINPDFPDQMILGNDGGLNLSWDRGRTWDHVENFVAAQFYAIAVDDAQPFYNVCGGLQDNNSWCGPSRTKTTFGPTNADWYRTHGGDGFFAVPDPNDNNLIYAEMQSGGVVRYDTRTGQSKNIKPIPRPGERHRYNWNAPILPSRHEPRVVYFAANYLFKSSDRGDSWQVISPDLTRAIDRNKLPMRGKIPDSTALGRHEGTAEFSNITTIDESSFRAGLLVVGTDDGVIQVTRDGGKTWQKSDTFPGVPDTTFVSRVIWSRANEGTIYATFDGHRSNDFKPYAYRSTDYGKSWTSITSNLPDGGSVQVIREHPRQPNLLFAGTEFGVFASTDGGARWTQLKSGIPATPVHDLAIQPRANDLVVGTHGRGIYILDDLTPLERLADAKAASVAYLFPVQDALLFQPNTSRNSGMGTSGFAGQNPPPGTRVAYTLNTLPADAKITLTIVDASGTIVRQLPANTQSGLYRAVWDMRVGPPLTGPVLSDSARRGRGGFGGGRGGSGGGIADSASFSARGVSFTDSSSMFGRGGAGGGGGAPAGGGRGGGGEDTFLALPGVYKARLTVAPPAGTPVVLEQSFALRKDPAVLLTESELRQLYAFRLNLVRVQRVLREAQARADTAQRTLADAKRAADAAGTKVQPPLKEKLAALEKALQEIVGQMGGVGGGRGGRGGGGAGAAGGGRGGGGGGGPTEDNDQNAPPPVPASLTLQSRLGTMTELLNVNFNPSPEQAKTLRALPQDVDKQAERVKKVAGDELPALIGALKAAGVEVKPAASSTTSPRPPAP